MESIKEFTVSDPVSDDNPKRKQNHDADESRARKSQKVDDQIDGAVQSLLNNFPYPKKFKRIIPSKDQSKTVNIAVSSRALFNLDKENEVFMTQGLESYIKYQNEKESELLKPGTAFPFIYAMENVNEKLIELNPDEEELFTIILMSHNHASVGIRLQRSIDHYGLNVHRMALTGGTNLVTSGYLEAFDIKLFLTHHEKEVSQAIRKGIPAAKLSTQQVDYPINPQLRIAFDLDAVLFSDESEKIFKAQGLDAFLNHEIEKKNVPLKEGPLKPFAQAIGRMQKKFPRDLYTKETCPMRTYIVTARDASVGERALNTLRHWGLEIDECFFLGGAAKSNFLRFIKPHIFFDDQIKHIVGAHQCGTPAGHVRHASVVEVDGPGREKVRRKIDVDSSNGTIQPKEGVDE